MKVGRVALVTKLMIRRHFGITHLFQNYPLAHFIQKQRIISLKKLQHTVLLVQSELLHLQIGQREIKLDVGLFLIFKPRSRDAVAPKSGVDSF